MPPSTSRGPGDGNARGPGRPRLPVDRIVGAAKLIVDQDGADALTLRSLAAHLGSSTSTLYRHFPGRAELTQAVVDSLFAEVGFDDQSLTGAPWDVALLDIAGRMFDVLDRHRNATPLLLSELPTGPHALRLRERCLSVLTAGGFSPQDAVRTYATVARYVLGFGVQASSAGAQRPRADSDSSVGSVGLAEEFAFGLQLMVDGLRARHDAPLPTRVLQYTSRESP